MLKKISYMLSRLTVSSIILYPSCLIQGQASEVPQDTDTSQVVCKKDFQDFLENHEHYTSLGKRLLQEGTDTQAINLESSRQLIVDILSNVKLMKDYLRREKCGSFLENPFYDYENWLEKEQKFDPSEAIMAVVDTHTLGGYVTQEKTISYKISSLDAKAIQFYLPYLLNYSCFLGIKIKALTSNAQITPIKTFFENTPSDDTLLLSIISLFVELRKLKEDLHSDLIPRFIVCLKVDVFKTKNDSNQSITARIGDKSIRPEIQKMERIRNFLFKTIDSAKAIHSLLESYNVAIAKAWNLKTTKEDKEKYGARLIEERNKKLEQPLAKFRLAFKSEDQKVLLNYYNNLKSRNEMIRKIRKYINDELIKNPWTFDGETQAQKETFPENLPQTPISVPTPSAPYKIHLASQIVTPAAPSKPAPSPQLKTEEQKPKLVQFQFPSGRKVMLGRKSERERQRKEEEAKKNAEALQQPIVSMLPAVNNKSQAKQNKQQEQPKQKKNNQHNQSSNKRPNNTKSAPATIVKTPPQVKQTTSPKDNELQCVILPDGRKAWLGSLVGTNESKPVVKTAVNNEPKIVPQVTVRSAPQKAPAKNQGCPTSQSERGNTKRENNLRQNTAPTVAPVVLTVEKPKIEPKKISMEPISGEEKRKWSQVVSGEVPASLPTQLETVTPPKNEEKKEEIKSPTHKRQRRRKYKTVTQNVSKGIQEASTKLPQTLSQNKPVVPSSAPAQESSAQKETVPSQNIILGPILDPRSQEYVPTYYDQTPPAPYLDPELFPAGAYCYGPIPQVTPASNIGSTSSPATVVNHYHIYPTPIIYQNPAPYYYPTDYYPPASDDTGIATYVEGEPLTQEENLQTQSEVKSADAQNETQEILDKEGT